MAPAQSLRIEASKRAHAESLQGTLTAFAPELVRVGRSWQVEIPLGRETRPLLELIQTLGEWLEQQQLASLILHYDGRGYTLLRPSDGQPDGSADVLLAQVAQLQTALETRTVIEQAKGVLVGRYGIGADEAFETLRRAARSSRTDLRALAQRVADERESPREIERLLDGS